MSTSQPETASRQAIVVSTAGQARHYRVQFRPQPDQQWQRFASFHHSNDARMCLKRLNSDGYVARLVNFSIAPAAA